MGELSRRDFLKVAAVSTGAIAFASCSPFPSSNEFMVQSTPLLPEDLATGSDNWYASVCSQCRAGCGIIVRVHQGRAIKIEGNPDHPVARGKLCALGQTGVQALYHPDRLRGPMRQSGGRGSGRFEATTWESALQELTDRLRRVAGGAQGRLLLISEPLSGHRALVLERFATTLGGQYTAFESLPRAVLDEAVRRVYSQNRLPVFDIARSQYVLSFGADFLGAWLSPVQYNRAYGEFRQGQTNRGHLVQIEPRMSQTGAAADEWLPVIPGSEGLLALSIAHVMVAEGSADAKAVQALLGATGASALDAYAPQRVAQAVGLSAERIAALAHDFASRRPALAIGGHHPAAHTNGLFNLTAILALNVLTGSVGRPGGVLFNPPSPFSDLALRPSASFGEWQRLAQEVSSAPNSFGVLLVHSANPAYGLPSRAGIADALAKIPFIASFSSFLDETSAMADLILPDHVSLETWDDNIPNPSPGIPTVGWQQPLVDPLYDTRDYVDVLLETATALGGEVQRALPFATYQDVLKGAAQQLQGLRRGSVTGGDARQFFASLQQKGGWWDEQPGPAATSTAAPAPLPAQAPQATFAGSAQEFPYHLVVYPHLTLGAGEAAHLPWAQATPDPMVSAAWETWLEINPDIAEELGIRQADIVTVRSPNGSLEVPAYVYPAIPRDVVAMPLGQGHKWPGRMSEQGGVNPLSIVAPLAEAETGALAWNATRVALQRTGRRRELPLYEGGFAVEPEPGHIVPTASA